MKYIYLFFSIFFLAGCATSANYEKMINSWVNKPSDDLIMKWGIPQSSYSLKNGGKVFQYTNTRNVQIGGYTYKSPQRTEHSGKISSYGNAGSPQYGNYSSTSTTYITKRTPIHNIQKNLYNTVFHQSKWNHN